MSPPPAVAEKLCCAANTDSRPGSPLPFRRHSHKPKPGGNPPAQTPLLDHHEPSTSHTSDELIELQQIFAEAGSTLPPSAGPASSMALLGQTPRSRPATATERTHDEAKSDRKPKKRKLLKRLTRELSRSNLSLSNLKKAAAAKDKAQKEQQQQQQDLPGEKKVKSKKSKLKNKKDDAAALEMHPVGSETREVLLSRTYDSDAASLPDIRDSVVERLTKTVTLPDNDEEKAKLSPIKSRRSTDRRGDVSSIDWGGKGTGPYGWGEPSSSAPVLSIRIPEGLSDLGVLPSCNVSVEDLLQLYQPSGRSSPWKKYAEQHLRRRSKSADNLRPATPDLKPTELPSLASSFNSNVWSLSKDETPPLNLPLTGPKHIIREDKAQEGAPDEIKLNTSLSFPNKLPFAPFPNKNHGTDTTCRTVSEALPDAEQRALSTGPGAARRASVNVLSSNIPDSESASVHLHNMRISQHLRSESTLSGISGPLTTEMQQPHQRSARGSVVSGVSGGLGVPPTLHTQPSNSTVRKLRCSSSGFASERVPEGWGNVVSAAPSSVYSTRQNSLASSSCTPVASQQVNAIASSSSSGPGAIVRKSGYEVLNLSDVGALTRESAQLNEKGSYSVQGNPKQYSAMPGAFPPSSSTNLLNRADTGLTFRTANERPETTQKVNTNVSEKKKQHAYELLDSSDQTTNAGEDVPLRPNQQSSEETTDSSLDITPVTAIESPVSSEKVPREQLVTPPPAKQPSSVRGEKKTPSIKTPSKRFSTFSFFRRKTYANLRRASHSHALHARKTSRSQENLVFDGSKDKTLRGAHGLDIHTDGPSDSQTPSHSPGPSPGPPPALDHKESIGSEPIEEHQHSRLSRSWIIGDGRNDLGQGAVWEKALQKHREEKSAMFLSPEKGGKAEARGLFRERSGSGSAISARSQLSDRKGKGPAIDDDFTFGGVRPGLQRSPTVLLDPLEMGFGEELARQKEGGGMLGDELRQSNVSVSLTPSTGISPGASTKDEPSVVSIEKDLHIDSWGGTTLADIDLGDLGAWSRYPSHTREQRTGPAGSADNVRTRDFAYEIVDAEEIEDESSTEEEDNGKGGVQRLTTLRPKKKTKTRSGMSKSKSMTFSRNFSFLKHYIGLFRSQSEEFRRHGHGHRSSIAEGGTLEHPELEMLPPVFSPVMFEVQGSAPGLQTDGATSKADLVCMDDDQAAPNVDGQAEGTKDEPRSPRTAMPSRREESKTDSSDGSWAANARLWTRAFGSDADRGKRAPGKKTNSSAEWWNNARTWTRFSTPSQDFQDVMDDARQKAILTPMRLERQTENSAETATAVPEKLATERTMISKVPRRTKQSSSDEWRSDARLFSQMYESCVQMPNFGSSEDANACDTTSKKPETTGEHHQLSPSASGTAVRLPSIGAEAEAKKGKKVKIRTLSDNYSENAGKHSEGFARNDSFLSIGSAEGTTMELMRFLHDLEEDERLKLEGERVEGV